MRLRNIPKAQPAIAQSPYCLQNPETLKGQWKLSFTNNLPIHLEIGMGKGQFISTLAKENPQIYYLGMEQYASVLYRALQKMEEEPLENLSFLCFSADQLLNFFAEEEVDKIYLNFSDPWPKDRHAKRRLTSFRYLDQYEKILKKGAVIEFKTDNRRLFDFSVEELNLHPAFSLLTVTYDLHKDPILSQGNIMTEYERKFSNLGHPICKLIAQRKES